MCTDLFPKEYRISTICVANLLGITSKLEMTKYAGGMSTGYMQTHGMLYKRTQHP